MHFWTQVCLYFQKQLSHKKSYSIIEVAKLFGKKLKFLPRRDGERFASALTNMNLSNKVYRYFGKIDLKEYIQKFKENSR